MSKEHLIDVPWEVTTYDSDTNVTDSEIGTVEVTSEVLANPERLREAVILDFEERGSMWEDWAYGDVTEVSVVVNGETVYL
jgi:hypothetical protein